MRSYKGSEFAKRLSDAIDRAHLRQSEVADKCGIHRSDMSRILKGERAMSGRQLAAVADLLGVSADSLGGVVENSNVHKTQQPRMENVSPISDTLPARVQAARDAYLGRHQHELSLAEARWIERSTAWIEEDGGQYDDDFWNKMLAAYRTAHPRNRH